ncbi:MAG: hypothetical protein HKN23_01330 [Verrucomicrobiales bacterium]|nr:hypothetical protein [Verrucomicrobiales bacterium]
MKTIGSALLVVALFLSPFASGQQAQVLNGLKAVVNGSPITQMEVDTAIQTQIQVWIMQNKGRVTKEAAEAEIKKMQNRALDDLIERKLILSEFEKLGGVIKEHIVTEQIEKFVTERFDGDQDKFLEELKKSGMTFPQFRKVQSEQIAVQALRARNSLGPSGQIINTPHELENHYNEIKQEFADAPKINLRMLSLPKENEQLIRDIRKQLVDGSSDFETLAKTHSVDSFASAGGKVGLIDRGVLNEKITNFVFQLSSGKVSEVFDDGAYWRLFLVDSKVGGTPPPFEKVKEQVDKRLTTKKRQENFERWIATLRRDANIRVY